jgi:hypothetical protein
MSLQDYHDDRYEREVNEDRMDVDSNYSEDAAFLEYVNDFNNPPDDNAPEHNEYESGFNPDRYKLKNKEELLEVFDCDVNWQKIIINRQFLVVFMTAVFKESGVKDARFCGSCVFGFPEDDLSSLADPYTVDLVSSNLQTKKPRKKGMQFVFKTFREYLDNRKPVKGKCNIYFVGDGHGKGEYLGVHWNCFIVDLRTSRNVIAWYDPSSEESTFGRGESYNFMPEKKRVILELLRELVGTGEIKNFLTRSRAQQICDPHPAQDVFCQTWVIVFVDVYINGPETWSKFKQINFTKWQNQPLKRWARCTIHRLPKSWLQELQQPIYSGFFTKCRRNMTDEYEEHKIDYDDRYSADVEKIPEIPMSKNKTCINNVVDYYVNL